ncbi:carbon storage regulator [Neptuniibacter sp. PT34_22]|uniref:carbon storage regulator n=1 Tax=Neptuniibacter sp. PT34_22 TaxID=3398205 RepID=UPI0039F475F4
MLTVTIKEGEPLFIGDDIVVYFEPAPSRRQAKISVDAPKDVEVLREKLKNSGRKQ